MNLHLKLAKLSDSIAKQLKLDKRETRETMALSAKIIMEHRASYEGQILRERILGAK